MIITPDRQVGRGRDRHARRVGLLRYGRLAVYVLALGGTFLVGAYAKWKHWDWIAYARANAAWAVLPTIPRQVEDFVESVAAKWELPLVTLDIKFKHVSTLREQRERALREGFLRPIDGEYVPGKLTYAGESVPVKLRLKGGLLDHVALDKWSLRLKVKGDQRPFGMSTFSLQHPYMRYYLNEWVFLENLRREGILGVRYQFVRLIINGEGKGIYALEEHFSKELLEAHGRREGVIIAFEERGSYRERNGRRDWSWWKLDGSRRGWHWEDWDVATRLSAWQVQELRSFENTRIEQDASLPAQRDEAIELLRAYQEGRRKASDVFDIELMGRYMAMVDLWRAWHAVLWQNTRYYFNPITGRLEPIGFDTLALWGPSDLALTASQLDDRTVNGPLRDPPIARVYLRELERISAPSYLEELKAALEPDFARWRTALKWEYRSEPTCRVGSDLSSPWEKLAERQAYIREALHTDRTVIASAVRDHRLPSEHRDVENLVVELRNITVLPVEVIGFRVNGGPLIPATSVWTRRREIGVWENADGAVGIMPDGLDEMRLRESAVRPLIIPEFVVPVVESGKRAASSDPPAVEVATRFLGQSDLRWSQVRMRPPRSEHASTPLIPTPEEALRQHPFLKRTGDTFVVPSGTFDVAGDLIVPSGMALRIEPGVTLRFEPQAILYTTGPLHLQGTPDQPIQMMPLGRTWGGVIVMASSDESIWTDAVIRDTAGIARGGWMLTGGVTFFKSDSVMSRVTFAGSRSEDALNVIHAHARLSECKFRDCASDAFDGDYVTGVIEKCRFKDVGGDALDVSGSTLKIDHVDARNVADKVISAGEESTLEVTDLTADNVGTALACKDSSSTRLVGAEIREARIGLACYQKKAVFGPATITAKNVLISASARWVLVQTGSSISLNGVEQRSGAVDVAALHADNVGRK